MFSDELLKLREFAKRLRDEGRFDDAELVEAAIESEEDYEATFSLRWAADMRAIKRWREANPGNELVMPDHADMVVWLLEQLEKKNVTPNND